MISVAMTTYNGEKYIYEQITSILNQSFPVDEIVICDDGSCDHTTDIIRKFNDRRIHLICNVNNIGYLNNFYKAIGLTKGDYVFLCDQDDIWEIDKVRKILFVMKSTNCTAACSDFCLIDKYGVKILDAKTKYSMNPFLEKNHLQLENMSFNTFIFGNVCPGCTYCITSLVREKYLKIQNETVIHDLQIMMISALLGKVVFINDPLVLYRIHDDNAVGFSSIKRQISLHKKIKKVPAMVQLIKDIDEEIHIPNKMLYLFLYYARIPYIVSVFRKAILGK
jgi:glycosyltransferase involved in cell wall biosynthesis